MKKIFYILFVVFISLYSCSEENNNNELNQATVTFSFSHNWDGTEVNNSDFNTIKYTNENGEILSIERLRYLISDITFTATSNEVLSLDNYNLIDLTNNENLILDLGTQIPSGNYSNVSFTFGFDNDDNAENYLDLNSASFNVPDILGGGYHYMQFDGKYLDSNNAEASFNYHAIRAVDNPGMNPTFPQDTFFTVNLGPVSVSNNTIIPVAMNIAEWYRNPNTWDLNELNTVLMPNSAAQIQMFQNGQTVFSLETISQ